MEKIVKKPETAMELAVMCAEERYEQSKYDVELLFSKLVERINKAYQVKDYTSIISWITSTLDEMIYVNEQLEERQIALTVMRAATGNLKAINDVEEIIYDLGVEYEGEINE